MEDEVRRWSVTYTKHVKQKRKVYKDGSLHFHSSTHKAKLFDECDKLLEIKILKNEEVVKSGETLTFHAYLVDVGDPEGDHKPIPVVNCQGNDKKSTQKSGLLHSQKFRTNSVFVDNTKASMAKNKAMQSHPSPSQKIIREFKKSEMNKYGAMQSSLDTTKSGVAEWHALYTTQITQKAKKYHDGILRLAFCGSAGRQVMLYDASRKLLDSRFLKKDEIIRSGEALTFDAHLVDIGEPEGNHMPSIALNVEGKNSNEVRQTGILYEQENRLQANINVEKKFKKSELNKYGVMQSSPDTTKSGITEWQALYTTQITQKAKKYHDGFLQLTFCGSQGRQAMLYDASRKLLGSRFLKNDEVVGSGGSLAFDAHLVDIGEPEGNHMPSSDLNAQGRHSREVRQTGILYEQENHLQANRNVVRKWHALYTAQITQKAKKYNSGILRLALCGTRLMQVTLLNEDGTTLSSKHLKFSEEFKSGSTLVLPKYLVEVGEPWISHEGDSQDNACLVKDLESSFVKSRVGEIKVNNSVLANKSLRNRDSQESASLGKDLDSRFGRSRVGETEIKVNSSVPANKPLRNATSILSILKSSMPQESVTSIREAPMEQCPASHFSNIVHSSLRDQVQGRLVHDSKKSRRLSEEHEDDFEALDEGTSTEKTYGSKKSNAIHSDLSWESIKLENSGDRAELQPINPSDGERKMDELLETTRNLDEGPSFDLGF